MEEFGSFSKEIAALLDISPNTLRRWSIDLEKKGYVFDRNDKDQRIYYKRDVFALKKLQQLINERVPMENALSIVSSEYNNKRELSQTLSVHEKKDTQITLSKDELESIIESTVEKAITKEREAMFKAFELKMNDTIEMQSRLLMKSIRDQQKETQKLIAAAEEKRKKGFWSKLFKR
ncbi:DNA-binding protein [Caldibacillus thermoamylovorans]|uniref:DNA-binding protein n=1 Tax=Caldibacillus thermoamylovorans TaxID=35841 RepID=UPI002041543B|nr:DNA-binding protein [Caldibacillus thermoamylovorans]MCM3800060.1 DNA-binding protein [Caldibacillus thermoamylovorans]